MKDLLPVGALVAMFLLAGCAGSASGGEKEDEDFQDLDLKPTATTGIVRGVVVDDTVSPIEGAQVRLLVAGGDAFTTVSDAQGRFGFQDLIPGTYFLSASHPLHESAQTTVDVVAGDSEPQTTRILLERRFTQEAYSTTIVKEGFFECTMAGPGPWYGSAMCVDYLLGPGADIIPGAHNLTQQAREWHADVGAGWQSVFVEMDWEPSAQGTSAQMGMVVSTYKPERNGAHSFAHVQSASPLWIRMDTGVAHATAAGVEPRIIPAEGLEDMSYFAGVRGSPAAVALNQDFRVYVNIFYHGLVEKEDWSFVAGDELPF